MRKYKEILQYSNKYSNTEQYSIIIALNNMVDACYALGNTFICRFFKCPLH